MALLYPAPYRVGMSSLGYQWVGHLLAEAGFTVERAFVDTGRVAGPVLTEEGERPLGDFPLVAVSVAWELELEALVRALQGSGIPPLRKDRGPGHPAVLAGGPLTFSNPRLLAPFADLVLVGEADHGVVPAVEAFFGAHRGAWAAALPALPGGWVPGDGTDPPPPDRAPDHLLPARSRLWSPEMELTDMFLVEGERGCSRACAFCVMGRHVPTSGMRVVGPERVLATVPEGARRVGLVGAAISDHPALCEILAALADRGLEVGVSSLRADRVAREPDLAALLARSGLRTLTVAADAASQRLRDGIRKGITTAHLLECAALAEAHQFRALKLYVMLGLPGEDDDDLDELVALSLQMATHRPLSLGISPFVPKRGTPLAGERFAGIDEVERRVAGLRDRLRGRVEVSATSARWAWVEAVLARAGEDGGEAVAAAVARGGGYGAWRRALGALGTA